MVVILSADGDDAGLLAELARTPSLVPAQAVAPGVVTVEADAASLPVLALARQVLFDAEAVSAPSIRAWARLLVDRVVGRLEPGVPWRLHTWAQYGVRQRSRIGARAWHSVSLRGTAERKRVEAETARSGVAPGAGEHRCTLVHEAVRELLKERRRSLLKGLTDREGPFAPEEALVQLVLTSPEAGWLSVLPAPLPSARRQWVSHFPSGEVEVASDAAPPSRAFAKLVEAQERFGAGPGRGEAVVDLGASPGGWTFVALRQGASVVAVDRSPLRADVMTHPRLTFVQGDAFRYRPPAPVDWLICDVIAAPERTIATLLEWLRRGDARAFIVTLKLKGPGDHAKLDELKRELPALASEWQLTHLCANKGEACVYGRAVPGGR